MLRFAARLFRNVVLSVPKLPRDRKITLRIDNLEAREQPGNMISGLLLGGAGVEPTQAMSAAVGDVAMLAAPAPVLPIAKIELQPTTDYRLTAQQQAAELITGTQAKQQEAGRGVEPVQTSIATPGSVDETQISLSTAVPTTTVRISDLAGSGGAGASVLLGQPTPNLDSSRGGDSAPSPATNSLADSPTTPAAKGAPSATTKPTAVKPLTTKPTFGPLAQPQGSASVVTPPQDQPGLEQPAAKAKPAVKAPTTTNPIYAVGSDLGSVGRVKVYNALTQQLQRTLQPWVSSYRGGVRVAVADVTGDGRADIITAQGAGGTNRVRIFNGVTGAQIPGPLGHFTAFTQEQAAGVFVAAADVTGDGRADLILGSEGAGMNHVKVLNGATGTLVRHLRLEDLKLGNGVRVGAGDINGDGKADIVAAGSAGSNSRVIVLDGTNGAEIQNYFAFNDTFAEGVNLAVGDVNGDGYGDVIAGQEYGDTLVKVFSGKDSSSYAAFRAFPESSHGVRVGVVDANQDGRLDVLVGDATQHGRAAIYATASTSESTGPMVSLQPFGPAYVGGTFVAGDARPFATAPLGNNTKTPDPVLTVTASSDVREGPSTSITFTVTRSFVTTDSEGFLYSFGGSATAYSSPYSAYDHDGIDSPYVLGGFGGNLTATITVNITDDDYIEGSETVVLNLMLYHDYTLGSPSTATAAIIDNDGPSTTGGRMVFGAPECNSEGQHIALGAPESVIMPNRSTFEGIGSVPSPDRQLLLSGPINLDATCITGACPTIGSSAFDFAMMLGLSFTSTMEISEDDLGAGIVLSLMSCSTRTRTGRSWSTAVARPRSMTQASAATPHDTGRAPMCSPPTPGARNSSSSRREEWSTSTTTSVRASPPTSVANSSRSPTRMA